MNARSILLAWCLPSVLHAQFRSEEYARRREALTARTPEQRTAIIVLGAPEPVHDYLEFHQSPGMRYLTGIREPDAALVMVRDAGKISATVFVLPRDPAAEVWTGVRLGLEGAARETGLAAREAGQLMPYLDSLARTLQGVFYVVADQSQDTLARTPQQQFMAAFQRRHPGAQLKSANQHLAVLRGRKSVAEQAMLRRAVEITTQAHREAARALHPEMYEFELESVVENVFRRNGSERPGFASIVGSGPNSTVLHYNANERQMRAGEVVVIDIGALYKGYSADVTRTLPVSGTFSPEQRQIYHVVRDAQAAAERQARPGARAQEMRDSATAVIAAGLTRLGLIDSPTAMVDVIVQGATRQIPQYAMYYMHGLGHGIGLEVHDPEQYYVTGTLAEGSAFTIEPGIYVRPNLLEILADTPGNRALIGRIRAAVERHRGTGVRIEDDYLVTERGLEWISRGAPREITEIEALMKSRAMPPGRNAELLRAFGDTVP